MDLNGGIHAGFLASADRAPGRVALVVDGERVTYGGLRDGALAVAAALRGGGVGAGQFVGVLAHRSRPAYEGVLAALCAGAGYLPLNPMFPVERNLGTLERSGAASIVADVAQLEQLEALLARCSRPLLVILRGEHEAGLPSRLRASYPRHQVVGGGDLPATGSSAPAASPPDDYCYLLFTSGSTGQPKGVPVRHRNAASFLGYMLERYDVGPDDRFSQNFEMSFDPSVFDMFVCWTVGAELHVPSRQTLLNPSAFLREAQLTVWYSVPSIGVFLKRMRALKPGRFPSLRYSLFAGEALTPELAAAWSAAAPHSCVDNLYGPTEVTVTCMHYRWDPGRSPAESEAGSIPIGAPNPAMTALVVDGQFAEVAAGETGELLVAGPQVTGAYWEDPGRTAAAFVRLDGHEGLFYRTGDLVRRPARDGDPMPYLGRIDDQVQIHGHRVELGEVESAVREVAGIDPVVAVPWPQLAHGSAGGIEIFVQQAGVGAEELARMLRDRLPEYMLPRRVHLLDEIPVSAHGKFDRKALVAILEGRS